MRMILQNYLDLEGVTIEALAQTLQRSRESIRRWRDDETLSCVVVFDPVSDKVERVEISRTKIIEARS